MTRRAFVAYTAAAGVASLGGLSLSGCSGDSESNSASDSASAPLPTRSSTSSSQQSSTDAGSSPTSTGLLPSFHRRQITKPDFPPTDKTFAAYLRYPTSPQKTWKQSPPGEGGQVTMVMRAAGAGIPPDAGNNPFLAELNKRLGVNLKINHIPLSQYWTKLATVVAGGDLPDLTQFNRSQTSPPHLGDVLKAKYQDLSKWLSDDAINNYPNLAGIPTLAWRSAAFNEGIYGVPYPLSRVGGTLKIRQDIADDLGIDVHLESGDDLLELCKNLTSEKDNRWALGVVNPDLVHLVGSMTGVPNQWDVVDGQFKSYYEAEAFREAIEISRTIWKSGYVNPDALTSGVAKRSSWFLGGVTPLLFNAAEALPSLVTAGTSTKKDFKVTVLSAPSWKGGGQAPNWEIKGSYTFTAFKKASDDRVEELLRISDWCAAPFGSEEYLFSKYGIPDRDYTLVGTDPVPTKTGDLECNGVHLQYLATSIVPIYVPGSPDVTKALYQSEVDAMKHSLPLPTVGLSSETEEAKGASINKAISSVYVDIIVGRKPMSAWDGAVKKWLADGGAKIAQEYTEAYAKQGQSHS